MNTTVYVLFYIKRSKTNNEGICPIYARVTIQAKRFEFSANKYLNPERWSPEGSKVKGTNEEARTINSHLDYLKNQVLEAEKRLFKKDIKVTSENLKNEVLNATDGNPLLLPHIYSFPETQHFQIKELQSFLTAKGGTYVAELKEALQLLNQGKNIGAALKMKLSPEA